MFSDVDKYGLTHDLIKVAFFNILTHIAMELTYNESKDLFGAKFLFQLSFVLMGFALFYLFVEPHVKKYYRGPSNKNVSKKA